MEMAEWPPPTHLRPYLKRRLGGPPGRPPPAHLMFPIPQKKDKRKGGRRPHPFRGGPTHLVHLFTALKKETDRAGDGHHPPI